MGDAVRELEERMNRTLDSVGLRGWTAIWDPDHSKERRGESFPRSRTILIHDEEPDEAMETLLHEVLEVKMRPMLHPLFETVNGLIEVIQKLVYQQKEQVLDEVTPLLVQALREDSMKPVIKRHSTT